MVRREGREQPRHTIASAVFFWAMRVLGVPENRSRALGGRDVVASFGSRICHLLALLIVVVVWGGGCRKVTDVRQQSIFIRGLTMGTSYAVRIPQYPTMPPLKTVSEKVDAELQRIEQLMSTYRQDSEITGFNLHRGTDWYPVSEDTVHVVALAQRISQLTDGRFDITVKPLVELWGFGAAGVVDQPPDAEEIERTKQQVGWKFIEVRESPPALRKKRGEVQIDLSGIAKGYAVDRVAELLESLGAPAYFVEVGGEIRCKGERTGGGPWRVGIERPDEDRRSVQEVLLIHDGAVATSGDYRNFFLHDGRRYQHTIDPVTGYPVDSPLASVTVVAESCAWADAIATGLMALGAERGWELANGEGWAVMLISRNDGGFRIMKSPEFIKRFPENK